MKNKSFFAGMITMLIIVSLLGTAAAVSTTKTAELVYRDIKITLDGEQITPKDANGVVVEPFIIDGTTYLPVRAVADAMGLYSTWNGDTNTVELSKNNPEEPVADTVDITGATLTYSYGVPRLYLDISNYLNSDIERVDIKINCYDAYGEAVFTTYNGYTLKKIEAGTSLSEYWDLYGYSGVSTAVFGIYKYKTSSGDVVEISEDNIHWYKTSYSG